ncbi:hypothetical protein [Frankia sp. AiPa1]|uniref:hypothetical protein n=1 Tax=Frankia sp. AiPa1 TaxID=573492 RepID=UPI00202B79AD|nr:hypothetical protein [Frankia sp. AiPa1]MCL9760809.1 hypothetical protein [Frankia sp. AiPa1]
MNRNPAIHHRPSGDIDIALADPGPDANPGSGVDDTSGPGRPSDPGRSGASPVGATAVDGDAARHGTADSTGGG